MTPRTRWLILAFALVGLFFAAAAAYVHYKLLTQPNYVSPCDINARFNCSEVYLSRYGSFHGVPVALGGVIWFAAIALLAGLSGSSRTDPENPVGSYIFAVSTIGLAAILYFAYASFFVLKTGCVLCIGTYAAVAGIFVVSGSATSTRMTRLPGRLVRDLRSLVADPVRLLITLVFVVASAALVAYFPREGQAAVVDPPPPTATASNAMDSPQKRFDDLWAAQPRVDLGIPAGGAKVVVVKFNDWQCPSCKAAYFAYKPVFDKYAATMPGAIKSVTKDYPLNVRCNYNVQSAMHAGACEAAAAVRLAEDRGKTDAMVTWLFANQESLTPSVVEAQVKSMLGVTDFGREYARLLPEIKRDVADGGALHIQFTPTYYVNGVKADAGNGAWLNPEYFDYAIQYEIRKAGGFAPR